MGVCCIVFDIDGMLFEFFMNILNIEQNTIKIVFSSKCHVFFAFYAISNILYRSTFFLEKHNSVSFHVLCYFQPLKKIVLKSVPSLTNCIPRTKYVQGILWFSRCYAASSSADTLSFSR